MKILQLAKVTMWCLVAAVLFVVIYLIMPSDVVSREVAAGYIGLSSKDNFSTADSPLTDSSKWKDNVFDTSTPGVAGSFMLPFRGTDDSVVYTLRIDSNVGSSPRYSGLAPGCNSNVIPYPHTGVDMTLLRDGVNPEGATVTDILAVSPVSGKVVKRWSNDSSMGNCYMIESADGNWYFFIMHMREFISDKTSGTIEQGEVLGYMGCTGAASGYDHVHMSMMSTAFSSLTAGKSTSYVTAANPWNGKLAWVAGKGDERDSWTVEQDIADASLDFTWFADDSIDEILIHQPFTTIHYSSSHNQTLLDKQIIANANGHRPIILKDEGQGDNHTDRERGWTDETYAPK